MTTMMTLMIINIFRVILFFNLRLQRQYQDDDNNGDYYPEHHHHHACYRLQVHRNCFVAVFDFRG